jgi:hypothetical protein
MKTHLVIHHSGTKDGNTLTWPIIRKDHISRGWVDIGYHLGVEWAKREGTSGCYELLAGRPLTARAAGEPKEGMNRRGIHVCFIGNYDLAEPAPEMWRFVMPHLASFLDILSIPVENVIGHREIADVGTYKQCPGKHWNMHRFRAMLGGQP